MLCWPKDDFLDLDGQNLILTLQAQIYLKFSKSQVGPRAIFVQFSQHFRQKVASVGVRVVKGFVGIIGTRCASRVALQE